MKEPGGRRTDRKLAASRLLLDLNWHTAIGSYKVRVESSQSSTARNICRVEAEVGLVLRSGEDPLSGAPRVSRFTLTGQITHRALS